MKRIISAILAAALCVLSLTKELSEISKDSGESFVFSPASSALQLVMLANAASPDIRQDILLGFGGTLGIDDLNPCSSYFMSRMEAVSKSGDKTDACVKLGGALLVDNSLDVKTAFLQNIKDFFGYDVLRYKKLIATKEALKKIEEVYV